MKFLGYVIKKQSDLDELEQAKAVLERHGFRAVRKTANTSKKVASAAKANQAKQQITQEKLQNGLNLWRLEGDQGKTLTAYKLAQLAGVSQNTAKKYLDTINAV